MIALVVILLIIKYYAQNNTFKQDKLFLKINSYHPNIKLTIEITSSKFLDTKTFWTQNKNEIKCFTHNEDNRLPFHWTSAMPKSYKKIILEHIYCDNKVSSNFKQEILTIKVNIYKSAIPMYLSIR